MTVCGYSRFGAAALVLVFTGSMGTAAAQGVTGARQGQGGSVVQGAAGTKGSAGHKGLEQCDRPMGALAVVEPQDFVITALRRYNLGSPVGLIRLMIQQSNCFVVVERGVGLQNAMQERSLQQSGELRADSNMGKGQMVTADYILTPAVVFSEGNAGGVGGAAVGRLFGRTAGAVAGALKFKEAQTSMLVADARTTVQVASAEGSTRKADMALGGLFVGGGGGAAAGGYGNTNEGKIIAAALMDNYNNIVRSVRNDPALQRSVGSLAEEAAGGQRAPRPVFAEGDVLSPKIGGVKMLAQPSEGAKEVASLTRSDEVVVIGKEQNGFVNVQGATGSGWVKIVLLTRR